MVQTPSRSRREDSRTTQGKGAKQMGRERDTEVEEARTIRTIDLPDACLARVMSRLRYRHVKVDLSDG